ncbi:dTMP kinase [Isoptericola sp. F-RaC21]|uniref:dTMP kinase n=1 Tax=Isoptericola sp. F-RaC21 TaxID=3141452 RepID=UPI00315B7642
MSSAPGYFVSFEGGDGVGKTTHVRLLGDWLHEVTGREVVVTREPGGTPLGLELRRLVMHGDDMDARSEALLYAADRAHHVATVVRPAIERGAVVLTDRYLDSSVAYQAGGRELSEEEVEALSLWATRDLLPDVTVLLDLDPVVGAARLSGEPDRLERAGDEFHRRTRETFLRRAAADPERWVVVDASAPLDDVQAQVRVDVAARLDLTPALVDPVDVSSLVEPVETRWRLARPADEEGRE